MKRKLFALLLTLVLILSLSGCDTVSKTEDAIAQIGTVSLESLDAIQAAELLYETLDAGKQAKVENADDLKAARAEYDRLNGLLQTAITAINDLGFVNVDSGDAVAYARVCYDALLPDGLEGYAAAYLPVLEAAEKEYAKLYTEAMFKDAADLYARGDYEHAEKAMALVIGLYPDQELIPECKALAANAGALYAKEEYIAGQMESAVTILKRCRANYVETEELTKSWDLVTAQLAYMRPTSSKVFANTVGSAYGKFTVNASDYDACIKLESVEDPEKYILFFVRANESATVYVPDGDYICKYTTGEYWYGTDVMFGADASFTLADDVFTFTTTRDGNYIRYAAITITLYTVVDGNLETDPISAEDF
ncbi:MAG: hypothetical protein U0L15_06170 [Oscillospiraceae bacterium]|nr:hypothetical protein [Oscillospiraceae bacterium]